MKQRFIVLLKKPLLQVLLPVLMIVSVVLVPARVDAALSQAVTDKLNEVLSMISAGQINEVMAYLYGRQIENYLGSYGDSNTTPPDNAANSNTPGTDTTMKDSVATPCIYARAISKSLSLGMNDPQVKFVQRLLNIIAGEDVTYQPVATSAEGSFDNETTYFGTATKNAVSRWQERNMTGEYATGVVDGATRARLQGVYCAEGNTAGDSDEDESSDYEIEKSTTEEIKILSIEKMIVSDGTQANDKVRFVVTYEFKSGVSSTKSPVYFSEKRSGGSTHLVFTDRSKEEVDPVVTSRRIKYENNRDTVEKIIEFKRSDLAIAKNNNYYHIVVSKLTGGSVSTVREPFSLSDLKVVDVNDIEESPTASHSTISLIADKTNLTSAGTVSLTYKAPFRSCRLWVFTETGTTDSTSAISKAIREQGLNGTVSVSVNKATKINLTCNGDSSDTNPKQTADAYIKVGGKSYVEPSVTPEPAKISGDQAILMAKTSKDRSDYVFFEGTWGGSEVNGVTLKYDTKPGDCDQLRYELNKTGEVKQSLVDNNAKYFYLYLAELDEEDVDETLYYCYVGVRNNTLKFETATVVQDFTVDDLREQQLKLDVALQTGDKGPVTVVYDATGNTNCYIAGQRPGAADGTYYFRKAVTLYGTLNQTYFTGSTYSLTCDGGYERTVTDDQIIR